MATTARPPAPSAPGTFTRTSSGLVRQVGTIDTFFYGMMQIAVAYVVFIISSWVLYPGASMELSTALVLIGAVALGLVYALFSSVYPRSGGEYVFLSRVVHPAVGFVSSFMVSFWQAFYFGINGAFLSLYGLSPMFGVLGLQVHSQSLIDVGNFFTKGIGIFLTGTVVIVFFAFVQYRGLRLYFSIQKWGGIIALVSMLVTLVVLVAAATGGLSFHKHFDALAGHGAYNQVIAAAHKSGTNLTPGVHLGATLKFMIWPAFSLFFAILSASFNGEIKNVKRGQLIGITSSMVVSALLLIAIMFLGRQAVGSQYLLAATSTTHFPLAVSPYINVLTAIAADSWVLTIIMDLWIVLIMAFVAGATLVYTSRAMLAWGLDGLAPEKLSSVSQRHHTPGVAIVVTSLVALGCLAAYAFTDLVTILSGLSGMAIAFFITCVAGIFFPFMNRETFESSPAAIRWKGVPLISIAGFVGAVFLAYIIYRAFLDAAFGATSTTSVVTNGVVAGVAIVWYYAARWYRSRSGVDMDRRFAEIPIE